MKIVVAGPQELYEELREGNEKIEWIKVDLSENFTDHPGADAYFDLEEDPRTVYPPSLRTVFVNSVITPLGEIQGGSNLIRINGWKGFLKRNTWETAGSLDPKALEVMDMLGRKALPVADEPGFVAARILAMIINEAWFAKGEKVSTDHEIDTAMRLGTNYPKGPFEWAEEIGTSKIFSLLNKLKKSDIRYTPAPMLQKEFANL